MSRDRWLQIREMYHEVRERGREALKGADPEIRREVESLLDQDASPDALDRPPLVAIRAMSARSLAPGMKLGAYELISRVGSGGMGEVWKARDTRLNRSVAIKISSARFSDRFEREARAIAALNHPHICQIYDVGPDYLVMEFIEGKAVKGPMPLDAALKRAIELAGAMEAAHRSEITHRDLKPDNIFDTKSGIKVLDFGLAKVNDSRTAGAGADDTTLAKTITQEGAIIGTLQYMAPEQLQGQKVDSRADIFAFGCVLYEMLTGKRAFEGANSASVIAAILEREAPSVGTVAPASLNRVVKRCLAKNPEDRWQTARDLRAELEWVASGSGATEPAKGGRRGRWIAFAVAALIFAVAIAGWLRPHGETSPPQSFAFTIAAPPDANLPSVGGQIGAPLLSPDGSSALVDDLVRRMDSPTPVQLAGLKGITGESFWSPDSQSVAFFKAGGQLLKMRIPDGAPETIAGNIEVTRGGSWAPDGTLLIATRPLSILYPNSAKAEPLTIPKLGDGRCYHPEFLPDGVHFLFLYRELQSATGRIYLATLKDRKVTDAAPLMESETAAHFTPAGGGRLLFVRGDNLYALALDLKAKKLTGAAELIQKGVASAPASGVADFSVSRSGTIAWRPGVRSFSQATVFNREGAQVGTAGPPRNAMYLRLSPDDQHLLAAAEGGGNTILIEANRSGATDLGDPARWVWSQDGSHIFGFDGRQGRGRVLERLTDGSGTPRVAVEIKDALDLDDVSPDGTVAIYASRHVPRSVYAVQLDGRAGEPRQIAADPAGVVNPRFSPDGHWVVYQVSGSGIFVQPFPGPGSRKQIVDYGGYPVWRGDGKEILFRGRGRPAPLSSVAVSGSGTDLRFGEPKPLFPMRLEGTVDAVNPIAVSRDGSRIYYPQAALQPEESKFVYVRSGAIGGK